MTRRWWLPRTATDRAAVLLVGAGLACWVLVVYVVVVLGGGLLVGRTSSPDLTLSIVATLLVALSFDRARQLVERSVAALLHHGQRSPYDVLSTFTATVAGSALAADVAARIAGVLAEALGARWAEVWLVVDGRPVLAAHRPEPDAADPGPSDPVDSDLDSAVEGRHVRRVHHAGELLGLVVAQERPGVPFTATEERLLSGLADQAGLVLRGARLRAELGIRLRELSARAEELRASRRRMVDAQDEARRRLERDIHDGAQQHLVALTVNLRLAGTAARRSPERGAALLAGQADAVRDAVETLLGLARGLYPRTLGEEGLVNALRAIASASPLPVVVDGDPAARYGSEVEAAAYFCCLEALQNATKHADASTVRVTLRRLRGDLVCTVTDDGRGIAEGVLPGSGLTNMRDRAEAAGGTSDVASAPGGGTRVDVRLPLPVPAGTGR